MKLSLLFLILNIIAASGAIAADPGDVVINEIAWKTTANYGHIWIELYNNTETDIDLTGWSIARVGAEDILTGARLNNSTISASGFFLLEWLHSSDPKSSISDIVADFQGLSYNLLRADGENLSLKNNEGTIIDNVDCSDGWLAGDNATSRSMERIDPLGDSNDPYNWATYRSDRVAPYAYDDEANLIQGTPGQENSVYGLVYVSPDMPSDLMKVAGSPFFPRGDGTPSAATISYRNTENKSMRATMTIYDINGYAVRNLLRYSELASDAWSHLSWDGTDDYGSVLPVGIYIVRLNLECGSGGDRVTKQAPIVLGRKF